jgi:acyl carrier protein
MESMEAEVIRLLETQTGVPPQHIRPSSRLSQDLGIEGDDAVDFFVAVEEKFGTDLTALHQQWPDHFIGEGMSLWNLVLILPVGFAGGLIAAWLDAAALVGFAITIFLLVAGMWAMNRWGGADKMMPITVAEIVEAVKAGAWPTRAERPQWVESGHSRESP